MHNQLRRLFAGLTLAAALMLAPSAHAGEARDLVKARRAEVVALMKGAPSAERDRKVAVILGGLFDYDTMAERSLGKHWGGLTDDQRREFRQVLGQLIQRNIEKNVKTTLTYEVEFLDETDAGEGQLVKTRATSKTNAREEPVTIDYLMHATAEGHRAIDVVTEGSSMVASYRSQFGKIIAKDGYDALIRKMKARLTSR